MPIFYRNIPVSEPFTYDSVGNHWKQESLTRPKGYPLYHYLQTERGCGRIIIQGKKYLLSEGEGVLIAPLIRHSYAKETQEWSTLFATFTGTIESSLPKILGGRQVIFTEKDQAAQIACLVADAVRMYETPPADARALSTNCYCILMNLVDGMYTRELMEDPLYQKYVAPVIKEIETNYASQITVQELSSLVYITPQYLSRLFGRFLGCSAYEYLTACRINKAKELLLTNPRLEVQEAALRTGYLDASHFIAMFKKKTGVTPLEFRKMN